MFIDFSCLMEQYNETWRMRKKNKTKQARDNETSLEFRALFLAGAAVNHAPSWPSDGRGEEAAEDARNEI